MQVLITGAAGFIGMHLSIRLLKEGYSVIGIDNLNDYYDVSLKKARLKNLAEYDQFQFFPIDLIDHKQTFDLFENNQIDRVINLAAQAGVRYSLINPSAYMNSNIVGFHNILEACRRFNIKHLIYASSSSVYGSNKKMPFSEHDIADHPVSLYAATKRSNELLAHSYSSQFGIPTTGLRFFTVYGPWGRPDMAYFSFTKRILEGEPIQVFNNGEMRRDFTYIDDIVEGIFRLIDHVPSVTDSWDHLNPDPATSSAPYRIYNIGHNQPVQLLDFIETLEKTLKKKARIEFIGMQTGDVEETFADIEDLYHAVGFKPATTIEDGLSRFAEWYLSYYR